MTDTYEMRCVAYPAIYFSQPALLGSFTIEPGYEVEGDCQIADWAERANEDRSWVCWWEADWIEPEEPDYD